MFDENIVISGLYPGHQVWDSYDLFFNGYSKIIILFFTLYVTPVHETLISVK